MPTSVVPVTMSEVPQNNMGNVIKHHVTPLWTHYTTLTMDIESRAYL